MSLVLAGDIGGTNTRLLAASCTQGEPSILLEKTYASRAHERLEACLQDFIRTLEVTPVAACLAVAGPVQAQRVKVTNLPWEFSVQALAKASGIARVLLLNDFEAVGYGIPMLPAGELQILQVGRPGENGLACLIGAGTGLGQATLRQHADTIEVWPGEGGHIDFASRTDEEEALVRYWRDKLGRVSNETFVCGPGIVRMLEFVQHQTGKPVSSALCEAMQADDPAAAISRFALEQRDTVAVQTMQMFVDLYGAVAGNFALSLKPGRGVYLAGGIAPRILPLLKSSRFLAAFNGKPPMTELLQSFPVQVVMNPQVGLLGALSRACRLAHVS